MDRVALGVPEITQVKLLILSPALSAGVVVQLVMLAPLVLRVVGVTLMAVPTVPLVPLAPA